MYQFHYYSFKCEYMYVYVYIYIFFCVDSILLLQGLSNFDIKFKDQHLSLSRQEIG